VNGVLYGGYVAVINTSTFNVTGKLIPTFNASAAAPAVTTALAPPTAQAPATTRTPTQAPSTQVPPATETPSTTEAPSTTYPTTPNPAACINSNFTGCWHPTSVSVTPNGSQVWVSEAYAVAGLSASGPNGVGSFDYVYVFDTATDREIASISVGDGAFFMAMSKDGRYVYVANKVSCNVDEISTATFNVVASARAPMVDGCPYGIAASTTDSVAYAVTGNDRTVNMGKQGNMLEAVNFITGKVTALKRVGSDPVTVTLSPAGNSMYIADAKSPIVTVISTHTYDTVMMLHLPVTPPHAAKSRS
jgi:hypothetical protein